MNLTDLLSYTAKEYLDDRADLVDGSPDELFSDTVLVRYFNEAARILARKAWILTDIGHAKAGTLVLQTGKEYYKLHSSVLRVYRGTLEDSEVPLGRTTDERLSYNRLFTPDDPFDINLPLTATPGRPVAFATDSAFRILRLYPKPSSVENGLRLILKVARMPICPLSLDEPKEEPEIPEEYQLEGMCKFAAGKCLTHPSVDVNERAFGRSLLAEFDELVREARRDRQRAEQSEPRPHYASSTAVL